MGRRGPPRTPTVQLAASGSRLAAARLAHEPTPVPLLESDYPDTSHDMTKAEREIFETTCDKLRALHLLSATDGDVVGLYSMQLCRFEICNAWLREHNDSYPVYDVVDGTKRLRFVRRFPQSVIRAELESSLLRLARELGLTSASRAAVALNSDRPTGPLASKYLQNGGA